MVTTLMREYLANVAEWLIDPLDEAESVKLEEERASIFRELTKDEQDRLNSLVEDIFGKWL
jgi:hypothetical protein